MAIVIHRIHRELAMIALMNSDKGGNLIIGYPELRLILPLLKKNLELVYKIDGLKEIAFAAQCNDQMDLVMHFTSMLEGMEVQYT